MKKCIFVLLVSLLAACGPPYYPPPQYIQSPTGQQMVVVNDRGTDFLVDYMMFQSLGYGGCLSYRHSHPGYYHSYDRTVYGGWHTSSTPYRSYQQPRTNGMRSNPNSPPVTFRNTSTTTRTSGMSSSGSGYKPTFRNTSTRSGGMRRGR